MPVDQKQRLAAKYRQIAARITARREVFAHQGSVVETRRCYGGRRLGPYYRLAWREAGQQRSIYLGRSPDLAEQVWRLLARLQAPDRSRRALMTVKQALRIALRRHKARWARDLSAVNDQGVGGGNRNFDNLSLQRID